MCKISIISPVYNQENYLTECIESVLKQDFTDFEAIFVDDGSTDSSASILEEYAQKDSRIKVITKENEGQGVARNIALKEAKGKYIVYLDPDDWFEEGALSKIYNKFQEDDYDIIFYNAYRYYQKTGKKNLYRFIDCYFTVFNKKAFNSDSAKNILFDGNGLPFKAYKKDFLLENDIKYTPAKYIEDSEFFIKSVLYAKKMVCLDEVILNYRIHENSSRSTANKNINTMKKTFFICNDIVREYCKNTEQENGPLIYSFLKNRVTQLFHHFGRVDKEYRREYFYMFKDVLKYIEKEYSHYISETNSQNIRYDYILNCSYTGYCIRLWLLLMKVHLPVYFGM